jgi:hypothetical protein
MTENTTMPKIVCTKLIGGVDTLLNLTIVAGAAPNFLKTTPGVGKPFWYWPIPPGQVIACDFTDAPIVTASATENAALIEAITTLPEDVLSYVT